MAEAYCVKDKRKVEVVNPQHITMKNGKPALQGNLPDLRQQGLQDRRLRGLGRPKRATRHARAGAESRLGNRPRTGSGQHAADPSGARRPPRSGGGRFVPG